MILLPKVDDIKTSYERRDLDEHEIKRFDEVIDQRFGGLDTSHFGDETLDLIIEDAEKWDNIPREVYVVDFWKPPEVITNYLTELGEADEIEKPGLEGIKFSQILIEAGCEMDSASHGYLIEVDNKLDNTQSYNPNMIGGVSRIYDFVPIPDIYQGDDIFTENRKNQKLGIISDDYSLIAQQGLKTAEWMDEKSILDIPYEFRQAIKENLDSYSEYNQSEDSTERS